MGYVGLFLHESSDSCSNAVVADMHHSFILLYISLAEI